MVISSMCSCSLNTIIWLRSSYNIIAIDEIITLIDNNAHLFDYTELLTTLNYYHPIKKIISFHDDVRFHILKTYKIPIHYLLCYLDVIPDDRALIILTKYMSLYNDIDEDYSLLDICANSGKVKTVQYLLDIGITRYVIDEVCETIFDINEKVFFDNYSPTPESIICHKLIFAKVAEYIFNNSLRGTWIMACSSV